MLTTAPAPAPAPVSVVPTVTATVTATATLPTLVTTVSVLMALQHMCQTGFSILFLYYICSHLLQYSQPLLPRECAPNQVHRL